MSKINEHYGTIYTKYNPDTASYVQSMDCRCGEIHAYTANAETLLPIVKGGGLTSEYMVENPIIKAWELGGKKLV